LFAPADLFLEFPRARSRLSARFFEFPFLCIPGACSTFPDFQIYWIFLICSLTFHGQLTLLTLTGERGESDFRYEKGKLTLDLRRRSGQEVHDQKDELTAWIDGRIQKVSDFRPRVEAARATVQQSVGHRL
jgi:hypothetical protein